MCIRDSCEGDTVYFDWYHFLMDGHGVSPFLTRILEQYCNLRSGTAFANPPIAVSYTHLCGDGAWNSSQEAKYLTSVGHVDLSCEYKPVSYTHLDVYKRQCF